MEAGIKGTKRRRYKNEEGGRRWKLKECREENQRQRSRHREEERVEGQEGGWGESPIQLQYLLGE